MKVHYSILFLPLLLSLTMSLSAQTNSKVPYEDIYLKDGSVYHGYIAEQIVSTGQIIIEYTWADFTFERDKVFLSQFDDPVTRLIADGVEYNNVKVLETGDYVTFRTLDGGSFRTKSSEIIKTVRPVYEGIYDLVALRNTQQYKGHIIETVPGKSLKLLSDNGKVVNLLQKNIALQQRECKNKERFNIVMQSPFSEEYVLKNGVILKGVLVTQNYDSGLLTLSDNKGNPVPFSLKEIQIIRKAARPDFTIIRPRLGKNAVRINGTEHTGMIPELNKSSIMIPSDKHLPFVLVEPGQLTVEVDNEFVGSDQNVSPYSFFAFNPFQNDEGYYKLETVKLSKGKVTVSPDANERGINTTKYIYDHVARGLYALLNTKTQSLILIWVN